MKEEEKKMQKIILFDLDGTLLPMDQDEFTRTYFKLLAKKMEAYGYEAKALVDAIWLGTAAMVRNDGSCTNEQAFWKKFSEIYGQKGMDDMPIFDEFYRNDFQQARSVCAFTKDSAELVHSLKAQGFRIALATNPVFPAIATESRIRWAGLEPEEFELYTTYENIGFCKPNPAYYLEIAKRLGVLPAQCIMIGNDAQEDMAALDAGMQVFLLTDCIINKQNRDISAYPNGGFSELREFLAQYKS